MRRWGKSFSSQNAAVSGNNVEHTTMEASSQRKSASSPRMARPPKQPESRQSPSPMASARPPSRLSLSPTASTQPGPESRQPSPDMDQLRKLAYQQRQQKRQNRVITPNMLKARPIETKQNVVMRSKHNNSSGSVTSAATNMSEMTEKATNTKTKEKHKSNTQAEERIQMLEAAQKRLDHEHKAALAEAQKQAKIAADEEKRRLEVEQQKQLLEEQLRIEVGRQAELAAVEQQRRFKISATEAEEKRKAQAEAAERIGILEAGQRRVDQEYKAAIAEAQKQAKIAADEEKRRLEVEQQKQLLEEQLRIEIERQAELAAVEQQRRLEAETMWLELEEKALRQAEEKHTAQAKTEERIQILEAEQKRLDQEHKAAIAEAQKQAKIAADEEKRRLEVEQQKQLLEEQLRIEVQRQAKLAATEAPLLKSLQLKKAAFSDTQSYSGFFVGEGVSDCTSNEEGEIIHSNSTLKEALEVELPSSEESNKRVENTINDAWTKHDEHPVANVKPSSLIGSTSFDVGRVTVRHEVRRESRSINSAPVISSSAQRTKAQTPSKSFGLHLLWSKNKDKEQKVKAAEPEATIAKSCRSHDGSTSGASGTSGLASQTLRRLVSEQGNDCVAVDKKEELDLLDQACLKAEERAEDTKNEILEAASQVGQKRYVEERNGTVIEHGSASRVKQLELELLELSKEIAQKKEEAESLLKQFKGDDTPSVMANQEEIGESVEVMPTLSETEFISVNEPLSIDESAFAHKPNLLQRTGSLMKKNPLVRNGSLSKMSREHKRAFRDAKAMAKADNRFQEIVEVDEDDGNADDGGGNDNPILSNDFGNENATFVSRNGASLIDSDDHMYDEDVAALVAKSSEAIAHDEDDVDEFVVSSIAIQPKTRLPDDIIQIPTKRVPVHRVRSKEMAVQTDDNLTSQRMMSPRVMSPRPTYTKRESFLEKAVLFSANACTGGSRAVLACADSCNENNPDSRIHEAIERSYSNPNRIDVNYSNDIVDINRYSNEPNYSAAPSVFRKQSSGNAAYAQDEEELVTRAFVNALKRVDNALHLAGGEQNAREVNNVVEHSAMRTNRRHSNRHVNYDDIMSVDGRYVSTREQAKNQKRNESVPRNLELKPKMQTPRGSDQVWREELSSPKEKKGVGKMIKGIKKLTKARIVYGD